MPLLYHFIRFKITQVGLSLKARTKGCIQESMNIWPQLHPVAVGPLHSGEGFTYLCTLYKQIVPSKPSIKYTPPSLPSLLRLISIQFSITHYNNSQWLHLQMVWHISPLMVLLTHFYAIEIIFSCQIHDMYIIFKSRPCIDENPFNQ